MPFTLHIGGIETVYYKKDKDILDSTFQVGKRVVNTEVENGEIVDRRKTR